MLVPRLMIKDRVSAKAVSLNEAWNAVCSRCQDEFSVLNRALENIPAGQG